MGVVAAAPLPPSSSSPSPSSPSPPPLLVVVDVEPVLLLPAIRRGMYEGQAVDLGHGQRHGPRERSGAAGDGSRSAVVDVVFVAIAALSGRGYGDVGGG